MKYSPEGQQMGLAADLVLIWLVHSWLPLIIEITSNSGIEKRRHSATLIV
ncbi:hypothetical protein QUA77_15955 [Microcoleus sp. K5-D4]